nr:unnamed protein product [Digitaria exilis]
MVKAVVGDEPHLKALEVALSSSSPPLQAQVGLVVGKLSASSDRALVYSLLPTPPTEAAAPACSLRAAPKSKPSKGKAPSSSDTSLEFDVDWIAEHARQVSRMLLGGMSVIGIYVWASEASFKATTPAVLLLEQFPKLGMAAHSVKGCSFTSLTVLEEDINIGTEDPHQVDFLVSFKNSVPIEECSLEGVAGLLRFAGSVSALAYLGPKESISEAISDLKADIITSLRSRLDIILDEADDGSAADELEKSTSQKATQVIFHELREPYSFSFPRRVLIPWLSGAYVCDYLQHSETTEDATDRCKEVIPLETSMESSSILEPESSVACGTLESFWDMVPGSHTGGRFRSSRRKDSGSTGQEDGDGSKRQQGGVNFNVLAALFVLLGALIAGFVFTFSAGSNI